MHIDSRLSDVGKGGHDVRFSAYINENRSWVQNFTIDGDYISQHSNYSSNGVDFNYRFDIGQESGNFYCQHQDLARCNGELDLGNWTVTYNHSYTENGFSRSHSFIKKDADDIELVWNYTMSLDLEESMLWLGVKSTISGDILW